MADDEIRNKIKKRIEDYAYRSAKFRLALVKEEQFWKVVLGHIVLDISEPKKNKTFLKEENFALEDIYVSIEEFQKFFDYLGHVHIGDISREGKVTINKELQFTIGNYDLCFVGNFPSRDLNYYGRQMAVEHYGFDKPFWIADYYIHQSVALRSRPKVNLTGGKIPFRDLSEAINHFWKTHYEENSLNHNCNIYMPFFECSISNFSLNGSKLHLKFDIDPNLTNLADLSVGVIGEKKPDIYRKTHYLKESELDIDLGLNPDSVNVYLNHKGERIDVYNFYDYKPITATRSISRQFGEDLIGLNESYGEEETLLPHELISKFPATIQSLLFEAEEAFKANLSRATVILFRSAVEEGITLLLKQIGKEKEMYDERNFEIGLGKKIKLITEYMQSLKPVRKELEDVKWFGDKASHEAQMPINGQDISKNLEPKLRLILAKFVEELK